VFISITFVLLLVIFFYFPETKRMSLEEIDNIFGGIGADEKAGIEHDEKNEIAGDRREDINA